GDAGPVAQIAASCRPLHHGAILRRQRRDGPLAVAHGAEIFFDARLVLAPESGFHRSRIVLNGVEDALLTIHPGPLADTEQTVEQLVRQHFRRQRTIAIRPAQVALDTLSEGLLRHADL